MPPPDLPTWFFLKKSPPLFFILYSKGLSPSSSLSSTRSLSGSAYFLASFALILVAGFVASISPHRILSIASFGGALKRLPNLFGVILFFGGSLLWSAVYGLLQGITGASFSLQSSLGEVSEDAISVAYLVII